MAQLDLKLSNADKQWLVAEQPLLKLSINGEGISEINGDFIFDMVFYGKNQKPAYVINPQDQHLLQGERIQDKYQIRIILKPGKYSNLPQVYEVSHKIESSCQKWKSDKKDLHVYNEGVCCLCMRVGENNNFTDGFNLPDFFNNLVTPFFYAQSYFSDHGDWPWGDYRHGVFGVFEWYLEKESLSEEERVDFIACLKGDLKWPRIKELFLSGRIREDAKCICGGKKIKKCHSYVLRAFWKLNKNRGEFIDLINS